MKIIHAIASVDPGKGGPQAVVIRLAAAQAALGHDVHIVSYSDEDVETRASHAARHIPQAHLVQRHLLPMPGVIEALAARQARHLLRRLIANADFVHLHGVWESILPAAAAMARESGVPYCLRPAGMLDVWSLRQKAWKKRLALALGYKRMLDRAAFIQALNKDEAELMRPLAIRSSSIVIPNGIFLEELAPGRGAAAFRQNIPRLGDRPFVLFLSRLHYKKGLDILADAFAQIARVVPHVDLVVAGPDEGARASFTASIAAKGLSERVHLTGPLYGDDKIQAMLEAACFCLPSRQEGFSVAITEALACGLPAVITENCHFPEVATAGAGIVCARDAEAIAKGLLTILENPDEARVMGEKGRELVREHYTWPKIAERTIEAYSTTAGIDAHAKGVTAEVLVAT